jgi:hypothetical protein
MQRKKMKQIAYKVKNTEATTTYVKISPDNMDFILKQCKTIIDLDKLLKSSINEDHKAIYSILNTKDKDMPKMTPPNGFGYNSIVTMCEGTYSNITKGTQRDLSTKTMAGIQQAFNIASQVLPEHITAVEFVEGNPIVPPKDEEEKVTTTYKDIFDIDGYTETTTTIVIKHYKKRS